MSLPWFRLYTETIDDEKLRLLSFEDRWHFIALLCCKGAGLLDAGDSAAILRRKLCVKLGLAARELDAMADRLAEVDLIDAETFQPKAWDERQFKSDRSNERVKAFRARKKQGGNVTVTAQDTDTDSDTEKASRIGAGKAKGKSESQLEAAIAHAEYIFTIDGNAEARDEAIARARAKHGALS